MKCILAPTCQLGNSNIPAPKIHTKATTEHTNMSTNIACVGPLNNKMKDLSLKKGV